MRMIIPSLFVALMLVLPGCMSDAERQDVSNNSQAIYNAAQSLPPSPQVTAIQKLAVSNGQLVSIPIETSPSVTPSAP